MKYNALLLALLAGGIISMQAATIEKPPASPTMRTQAIGYSNMYPQIGTEKNNVEVDLTMLESSELLKSELLKDEPLKYDPKYRSFFAPNNTLAQSKELIEQRSLGYLRFKIPSSKSLAYPVQLVSNDTYERYKRSIKCFAAYIGSVIIGGTLIYQGLKRGHIKSMVMPGISLFACTGYHFFRSKKELIKGYRSMPCSWLDKVDPTEVITEDAQMLERSKSQAFLRLDMVRRISGKPLANYTELQLPILSQS